MIEQMIGKIRPYLPLTIKQINWDGDIFNMHGDTWYFTTMCFWRFSINNQIVMGCKGDETGFLDSLIEKKIISIGTQDDNLAIDPTFELSDGVKLEIFTTQAYEPWTFYIVEMGMCYVSSPLNPETFSASEGT